MNPENELSRFLEAQEPVFTRVEAELQRGRKQSHWMWFIFPQLRGLGRSEMAHHYGLASREEALRYWQHPVLGPRLFRCTQLMLAQPGKSALEVLGSPDDLKFCSCMTLFEQVAGDEPCFAQALLRYFDGKRDQHTVELL